MISAERGAREWFQEAARCYIDNHQGCAWCGGSHRVYEKKEGSRVTYQCHSCDFRAVRDEATGRYFLIPGEADAEGAVPETLFEM